MGQTEVIAILKAHQTELKGLGVAEVYLFGSVARDTAGPHSDVDLLVKLSRPMGWEFFDIQPEIEKWFGCKVDLTTELGLKPSIRERVLSEAIRVT